MVKGRTGKIMEKKSTPSITEDNNGKVIKFRRGNGKKSG